eukprot:GHVR01058485.1.p1 GENE.GHVR01058485.1~~GHVR01058485.1.p1  ORF type:complete len:121 (-),score=4.85 GHVR01058485.1:1196-1558(-)
MNESYIVKDVEKTLLATCVVLQQRLTMSQVSDWSVFGPIGVLFFVIKGILVLCHVFELSPLCAHVYSLHVVICVLVERQFSVGIRVNLTNEVSVCILLTCRCRMLICEVRVLLYVGKRTC